MMMDRHPCLLMIWNASNPNLCKLLSNLSGSDQGECRALTYEIERDKVAYLDQSELSTLIAGIVPCGKKIPIPECYKSQVCGPWSGWPETMPGTKTEAAR